MRLAPISEILRDAQCSADFIWFRGTPQDWAEFIRLKFSAELAAIMDSEGQTTPIYYDGWMIGNGHHRLAAAIMLGWDSIAVVDDDDYEAIRYEDITHDPDGWECVDSVEFPDHPSHVMVNCAMDDLVDELNRSEMPAERFSATPA